MTARPSNRNAELAQIHIARKQLAMEEDTYRDMLWAIGRVRSAKDLNFTGRQRVLEHLRKCGFSPSRSPDLPPSRNPVWGWIDTAAEDRRPMLRKIVAMLRAAGREKAYADGIAAAMFRIERLELCGTRELHAVVTALVKDASRRAARDNSAFPRET